MMSWVVGWDEWKRVEGRRASRDWVWAPWSKGASRNEREGLWVKAGMVQSKRLVDRGQAENVLCRKHVAWEGDRWAVGQSDGVQAKDGIHSESVVFYTAKTRTVRVECCRQWERTAQVNVATSDTLVPDWRCRGLGLFGPEWPCAASCGPRMGLILVGQNASVQ